MSNFVGLYFGAFFLMISEVYIWSKIFDAKLYRNNLWIYITVVVLALLSSLNYSFIDVFVRIMFISIVLCFFNWAIFRKKLNEIVICILLSQFLLAISEVIYFIVLVLILRINMVFIQGSIIGTFFGNVSTSILLIFFGRLPIVHNIHLRLVYITSYLSRKYLIFVCLFFALSVNVLMATIYFKLDFSFIIVINFVLLLIYFYIIYRIIAEKSANNLMKSENDSLIKNLQQYEDMVDRQRVDNHENKNQLLIIKNMIKKNDKDLNKYIDSIIKDKKEDDEILYTRVKTIPSGGLQGIIYQKMLVMKDERIQFSLDVSRDIRKINLDNLSMDDNYRLCKIVGVLLDNAIEASRDIEDKCIMISLYKDDERLVIDVSNRFNGSVEIERLDEVGYTSKGKGHGYGLSLVKKILSETDIFENESSIKKDVFKQVIKVKIKNT